MRPSLLVLAALALAAGAAGAQEVRLSRPEARAVAAQAVVAGDAVLAVQIANGLIEADPGDREAWAVLAGALIRLNEPEAARRAAAEAHRLSQTREDRYEAARLAALAARNEGRFGLSTWWLRRALLDAPSAEEEARTIADARAVRAQSPWRTNVALTFAPSDNVNGGSESPYNIIDGLPFVGVLSVDAQALSGWVGTVDATASRRLRQGEGSRTTLGFRLWGRGVTLSDEARELVEELTPEGEDEVTGGDFSYVLAETSVTEERLAAGTLLSGTATLGHSWSGGDPYYGYLRLSGEARRPLGPGQSASLAWSAERRSYASGQPPDLPATLSLRWSGRLPGGDAAGVSLTRLETWSDNVNTAASGWAGEVSWARARPLGPARLSARLGLQEVEYPDYTVLFPVPGGREDRKRYASVTAVLEGWQVGGFAPSVTLSATRTESNVSRFEGDSIGVGFGLQSTF